MPLEEACVVHSIIEAEGHWPFLLTGQPLQGHQKNLRAPRAWQSRAHELPGNGETCPATVLPGAAGPPPPAKRRVEPT